MKFRNIAMSFLAVAGVLMTSCIREDHSDCYNLYCLELSYLGDGTEEIFAEKIDRVDLYVFDSLNRCVDSYRLPDEDVKARHTVLPALPQGDHRVVLIANAHTTGIRGLSSCDFARMTFASVDYLDGRTASGNDPLYHASVDFSIEPYDMKRQIETRTARFSSSHYDISVEVTGVPSPQTKADGLPRIELVGVSPETDFLNVACGGQTTYQMEAVRDENGTLSATGNILRHSNHHDVCLRLVSSDGSNILAEVNFAEFIESHRDMIDVTRHEVLIPFKIGFKSAEIEVSLPDWMINNITPEF